MHTAQYHSLVVVSEDISIVGLDVVYKEDSIDKTKPSDAVVV